MLLTLILTSFGSAHAQTPPASPAPAKPGDYNFLVPLPGVPENSNLTTYVPAAINLTIGIAAVLAFIMITFGGIRYATADAIGTKEDGRKHIENALWGLILVIGAYAILNTLNPNMLKFDFSTVSAPGGIVNAVVPGSTQYSANPCCKYSGGVLQGYTLSPEQIATDGALRNTLGKASPNPVSVKNGPCKTGATTGCTNIVGLPSNAINGLVALENQCKCLVQVTGGTEGGHVTHGPNKPQVDLTADQSLNAYLGISNPEAKSPRSGTTVNVGGAKYTYENTGDNGRASGAHWHVSF